MCSSDLQRKFQTLPQISELESRRREIVTAKEQLPSLEIRDTAAGALHRLTEAGVVLAQRKSSLPDQITLEQSLKNALMAQQLLPYLERIGVIQRTQGVFIDQRDNTLQNLVEITDSLLEDQGLFEKIQDQLKETSTQLEGAKQALSDSRILRDQAQAALEKRQTTRGSQTCVYCGQTISKIQWEADFAQAEQDLQKTEEQFKIADDLHTTLLESIADIEGHQTKLTTKITGAQTRQVTFATEIRSLETQLSNLDTELTEKLTRLPPDNVLTLEEASVQVRRLPDFRELEKAWMEIQNKEKELNIQIALQTDLHEKALAKLPDNPLTVEEARSLVKRDGELQEEEDTYRLATAAVDKAIALKNERYDAWQRELGNLPDVPERQSSLEALEYERDTLSDAPEKSVALETAERDCQRIQGELNLLQVKIEQVSLAARRPIASLESEISECMTKLDIAQRQLRTIENEYDDLLRRQAQFSEAQADMVRLENQATLWKELNSQLGAPLQNWLLKEAEGHILEYANTYLDVFSQGNLALEATEGSTIPLDLACRNDLTGGKARSLQSLSGSQKFRVAVSLALALGQYASRGSQRIQSVIIDEGFGSLDADGQREMSNELRNLADGLERLIVVSHQETFADAFLDRYEIQLIEGTSVPKRVVMN